MKRLTTAVLILAVVASMLVAGCGKRDATPKLSVTAFATTDYDPVRKELYKQFEATHPGITIDYGPVQSTDYYQRLQMQFASNSAPDVIFTENVFFTQYARANCFLPLTPYIEAEPDFKLADFHDIGLEMYSQNGTQYCLPGNLAVLVLFYNKDMFDAEGIDPPDETWDWARMLEVAKKLTKRDSDGKRIALDVKKGDEVLFGKYAGTELKLDGEEHIMLREDDVLAVLDK